MRIAVVVSEFPSISESFILTQITGLIERGHNVEIFANRPKYVSKVHPEIEKYCLPGRTNYFKALPESSRVMDVIRTFISILFRKPGLFFEALRAAGKTRGAVSPLILYKISPFFNKGLFDVILCHFGPNGNTGILLCRMGLKGKVVTFFHGYDMSNYLSKWGEDAYEYLFHRGDLFLPVSEIWKRELKELGCPEKKTVVHRMGIDVKKFGFRAPGARKGIRLLTVARLVEKKGVRYGIEAVANLLHIYPELEYSVVGDGPLKQDLQALIGRLNCGGRIRLLGWKDQSEILQIMKDADILLAPSITDRNGAKEGIPVVLMEALALGVPVVSTFHSGIPELVIDGKCGFLVPEADPEALREKLEVLIHDPELMAEMGRNGREIIEQNYDIEKLNLKLEQVLLRFAH